MQNTNVPVKIPLPFANTGTRNTIPETTAGVTTPGLASFDVGFPPLTFTNPSAGGVPPAGADFNGIFNYLSAIARWSNAGAGYTYDATFSADTNVNGYPKGARLLRATLDGYWINQTEGNTTNPDTGGAGWAPAEGNLRPVIITLTATGSLTAAQAGSLIELNSATAATVTLPTPVGIGGQGFEVVNLGAGTWTFATAAGTFSGSGLASATGFTLTADQTAYLVSDGANWIVLQQSNGVALFASSGYVKLANGFILQWVVGPATAVPANTQTTITATLPVAFNTACYLAGSLGFAATTNLNVFHNGALGTWTTTTVAEFWNSTTAQTITPYMFAIGK